MKTVYKYLLLIAVIIFSNNFYCFAASSEVEIKNAVNDFCLKEFQGAYGSEVREKQIKYTKEKLKKLAIETCTAAYENPYTYYLGCDPLFIIDSYKVNKINQIDATHAYVLISYHQLGKTVGKGEVIDAGNKTLRKFIKDVRDVTVELYLEYEGKHWWIINPPYPKVSYEVMLKYYQDKCQKAEKRLADTTRPLSEDARKMIEKNYDNNKSMLDFLIDLSGANVQQT